MKSDWEKHLNHSLVYSSISGISAQQVGGFFRLLLLLLLLLLDFSQEKEKVRQLSIESGGTSKYLRTMKILKKRPLGTL